ncbi:transcription factor IBH1 [Nymphaea colorata]|nr:transcription factor IBH1 [Nymphaea colorata]
MKPSRNPNSLPPMFARRFLKALTTINLSRRRSAVSARARRIKQAADVCLASAAAACNAKRAWSRAVLKRSRAVLCRQRRRQLRERRRIMAVPKSESCQQGRAELLRQLVPGGVGMDFCGLLEEAADYIKSLKAQVQVMQCIADSLSC